MSEETLNGQIRLDQQTLENRAMRMPESMRELFVWLGGYCREECGRDIDLLQQQFVALGITHDKTTWSKILRGMWNMSASGHPTVAPCLAEDKFIKAVNALRNDSRIKELGGRISFVMTPTAQSMFDFIDIKRAPDRVNKFGVIIGETGSQKSATTGEYARRNNHGLVIKIEAPETPSMTQFMNDLARKYGHNTQGSYARKKSYVLSLVNARKTIIVENIQRLYDSRCGDKQPIFSFLQKLQEDTGCCIILTMTPTFEKTLLAGLQHGFFEQFEGRAGGRRSFLRLPPYPPEEDVLLIAKAFGMVDAAKHAAELTKIAHEPGRIRLLFELLQDAKIAAEADKAKLTINYVRDLRGEEEA
jgi:DNA transposition AAA+ family ATPase